MAYKQTIARPYARAVFEIARDLGALDQWAQMLKSACQIVSSDKIHHELSKPKWSAKQRAEMVNGIADDLFNDSMRYFIQLLAECRRLPLLPEVLKHFERYKAAHEAILPVKLVSAMIVSDQLTSQLKEALNQRYAYTIDLTTEVDPALIGGAVLYIGDQVIDGSIKGQLQRLHEQLRA